MRSIRNCNVCVTGGAGFLGSHLVDHLIEDRGCRVLVIDNLVVGRREFIHKDAVFEHIDITQGEDYLRKIFELHKTQYVFSYASYPYIPDSFARPKKVCDVNFMGAVNVINAAQEAGVEAILQVSSAEIYGAGASNMLAPITDKHYNEGKINEDCRVIPHSSYGVAKAAVDYYVQCRWREAKTPCIALRQFNCIGSRETHPYVVPEIIGQLAKQLVDTGRNPFSGKDVFLPPPDGLTGIAKLGNNSTRDFMYAGDAVRAAVLLLERGQFGEVFNLGSETGVKIYDLAKLIGKVMGFADVTVEVDESRKRPWEIWHLQSDNSKIEEATQVLWSPLPLEAAIKKTVEWFNENGRRWPWEKQ